MTDINKNKEEVKSEILNGQKAIEKKSEETLGEVKASNEALKGEVKTMAEAFLETSKAVKELVEEFKKAPENKKEELKMSNNEKFVSKSEAKESVIRDINRLSNEMLRGNLEGKQYNFFENDQFKNIIDDELNEKCFNSVVKDRIRQEIKNGFDTIKNLGPDAKKFPILNFEVKAAGDSYRASAGADGGYLMKPATMKETLSNLWDRLNPRMRDIANVRRIDTSSLDGISRTESEDAQWVGEEDARQAEDKGGYIPTTIKVGELFKRAKITRRALEDAMIDFRSEIANDFQEKTQKAEEKAFFVGDGLKDKPRGLMTYGIETDLDKETYELNKFKTLALATDSATVGSLIDALLTTVSEMSEDVDNMSIIMNPITYTKIITAKDAIQRYLADSLMPREINGVKVLAGCPVVLSKFVDPMINRNGVFQSNAKGIFVGNVRDTYTVVDRLDLITWIEAVTSPTYVTYFGRKRVGGGADVFTKGRYIMNDSSSASSGSSN